MIVTALLAVSPACICDVRMVLIRPLGDIYLLLFIMQMVQKKYSLIWWLGKNRSDWLILKTGSPN